MKHISILVPETAVVEAVADPRYIFSAANQFLEAQGRPALFKIDLVAAKKEIFLNNNLFSVRADKLLPDVKTTDLVIIPALSGDLSAALELNRELIPWIIQQQKKGAEIASLCIGAFLLAETGLLNGKKCSTHWFASNIFRNMFPEVELVDGHIITD